MDKQAHLKRCLKMYYIAGGFACYHRVLESKIKYSVIEKRPLVSKVITTYIQQNEQYLHLIMIAAAALLVIVNCLMFASDDSSITRS